MPKILSAIAQSVDKNTGGLGWQLLNHAGALPYLNTICGRVCIFRPNQLNRISPGCADKWRGLYGWNWRCGR